MMVVLGKVSVYFIFLFLAFNQHSVPEAQSHLPFKHHKLKARGQSGGCHSFNHGCNDGTTVKKRMGVFLDSREENQNNNLKEAKRLCRAEGKCSFVPTSNPFHTIHCHYITALNIVLVTLFKRDIQPEYICYWEKSLARESQVFCEYSSFKYIMVRFIYLCDPRKIIVT